MEAVDFSKDLMRSVGEDDSIVPLPLPLVTVTRQIQANFIPPARPGGKLHGIRIVYGV